MVRGEKIVLPKQSTSPSFDTFDETFDDIKHLFTFFEYIELENIHFENDTLKLIFADDVLYVTSNEYEIAGNIHRKGKLFEAEIPLLYVKKEDMRISGRLEYDFQTDSLTTEGDFDGFSIKGRFSAKKKNDTVNFRLESDTFTDLHPLVAKIGLRDTVKVWVLDRVKAQNCKLLELSGSAKIENKRFILQEQSLKAKALFNDCKIHFKERIQPAIAESFTVSYGNNTLLFDFEKPTYDSRNLEGSTASIFNVNDKNATLKLDLAFDTAFDAGLQTLIKAYRLQIPIVQKGGTMDAHFIANLGLNDGKEAFLVDVNLTKGEVEIHGITLPLQKGTLHYEKGTIRLEDMTLKDEAYEANIEGTVYLAKQKADLTVKAKRIDIEAKGEKFFSLHDENFPVLLEYKQDISLSFPSFKTTIVQTQDQTQIDVSDMSALKPYLSSSSPFSEGGSITLKTKNFKTFSFEGVIKRSECILYENEDTCEASIPFLATLTPSDFDFDALGGRIHYSESQARLKLQDINIDLEKLLTQESKKRTKEGQQLSISGKNSHLRYGNHALLTDSYSIELKKNADIAFLGSAEGDGIRFSKKNQMIAWQALRIKDKVLHKLLNFKGLQGGRYTFSGEGELDKTIKGEIIVEGGAMKDFKAYNNTLALINTLPELALLNDPGFSQKGFVIDEGVAQYRIIDKKQIIFDSIYVKGAAATIEGSGEIDLEKRTLSIDLAIHVARNLGKLIGSLPLVGYIVMGENKSATIGLKITGDLDKPIVNTSAVKEIFTLPLDIIKRTLETPARLIQ